MHQKLKVNQSNCSSLKKNEVKSFLSGLKINYLIVCSRGSFTLAFTKDSGSLKY